MFLAIPRYRLTLFVIAGALSIEACCTDGVGIAQIRPSREMALSVGESFVAEDWEGGSCNEPLRQQRVLWWTSDSTIVQVDSLSGKVIAINTGDAGIRFTHGGVLANAEANPVVISVHVR
jgi:hypothetical protein